MTLVIASNKDKKLAKRMASANKPSQVVSPQENVIYGMEKVIIIGHHPGIRKKYQGICLIEEVEVPKPKKVEDESGE